MFEVVCGRCGKDYEVEFGEFEECPNCGFTSEDCDHPHDERESRMTTDVGEGKEIEITYCGKCGKPLY